MAYYFTSQYIFVVIIQHRHWRSCVGLLLYVGFHNGANTGLTGVTDIAVKRRLGHVING